jgi:hypothetical protein
MQHAQYPLIYLYNVKMKRLQHASETLETYICNIGKGKAGLVDFSRRGSEPVMSRGARAPLAPPRSSVPLARPRKT